MDSATLKITLKLCSGSSVLPPKDIFAQYFSSPTFSITVTVFLQTLPTPFAGTDAPLQRALHALNTF
jgi:hypothetical protein